jgi:hypothetical protein
MSDGLETRVDRLERAMNESKTWEAHNDGRINALWKQQHEGNIDVEERLRALEHVGWKATGVWAAMLFVMNLIALTIAVRMMG